MESRVSVTELKNKKINSKTDSLAKDYVKNFSKAADANLVNMSSKGGNAGLVFANALKDKLAKNQHKQVKISS